MNAQSQIPSHKDNAYALIVGIGQYQDARIPKLEFTRADAKAFYELLIDPQRTGFARENVTLLLDAEATYTRIRKAVNQDLYRRVRPDSTVMIYFAGHGGEEIDKVEAETGKQAYYFLPWDADPEDLASTSLSQSDFLRLLGTLKSQRMVVFLDACHSTGVAKPGGRDLSIVASPDYQRLAEGEGRVVIAAAKPEQRSWEDPKFQHGIFTYHLLEAFRGKADANNDGYVSIQEIAAYLQREVPRTVKLLGKEPQDPTLICESLTRDIVFTVDVERVKQLLKEQDENERRRLRELENRRLKLVELRNRNELPPKEFAEAMALNEKGAEELSEGERDLKDLLESLLSGGIRPETYLRMRARMQSDPKPPPQPQPPPPPPSPAFCIHCGARNPPQNTFCFQCGKRVR